MTPDVNVHLLDFPNYGKEMVVKNEDDTYTILINAKLSHDAQIAAYEHAIRHITQNDFDKETECVQEIEAAAHQVPDVPAPAPLPAPIVTVAENIKQPPKRRRRRRNRKKEQYAQDRLNFILENFSSRDTFAMAEHQWLYGNDL